MNRSTRSIVGAALVAAITSLAPVRAQAQFNVARFDTAPNRVYTSFGLDPALVATVGYGRVFGLWGHPFLFTGDAGLVTAQLDARDFRVRLGLLASLAHWKSLHLVGSATSLTRGTSNAVYEGINFGADLTATLGWYRHGWFAGGEFGKDKDILSHIVMTDWYRTNFYPGAKSGWYLDDGGTVHGGLVAGLTLGQTELVMRVGLHRTERGNALATPGYASVGVVIGY